MRNIFNILGIIIVFSCKAQQTYPLSVSDYDAISNSYFKDLNEELTPYIGVWESNFHNKTIKLVVNKEIKRPYTEWGKSFFSDILIIRYEIKDSNGSVLQTTLNNIYQPGGKVKNLIMSLGVNQNGEINFLYAGGNCNVGMGDVLVKNINNIQFHWSYQPGATTSNDITCPPNLDYTIYLPVTENLVFTKQ
ncbi:DUF6705 family protein [Chryseobacterium sp.]|uniref:DUF6705 family protein n=1 Tax=Chryseobacterium sp. TaxID=1871047 RepID=UPI000EDEE775|nr:DUF6705 family protein [Chryseobacterium sp.]HCA07880.1 hypothetical protein [Chryseobacterium sp.]